MRRMCFIVERILFWLVLLVTVLVKGNEDECEEDCEGGEDEDTFISDIEEQLKEIGTAGVVGIIIGALAVCAIVPTLYCFLCGWLCFNRERRNKKMITRKVSDENGAQDGRIAVDPPKKLTDDKVKLHMTYHPRRVSYPNPIIYLDNTGTRHNSFISNFSSRKNSGVTNISGVTVDSSGKRLSLQEPPELADILYYCV